MAVAVSVILERKGSEVITITPDTTVGEAARVLADQDVGALVVEGPGRSVAGIVSERDLVRLIAHQGPSSLGTTVAEVMTAQVITCARDTTVDELMRTMTDNRVRHVPVIADGTLAGIVSIGDVVKSRLDELEVQARALEQYVTGSPS